ncbi:MAG: hypothetical protein WBL61_12105 [Bryobacteraceae bacterium]
MRYALKWMQEKGKATKVPAAFFSRQVCSETPQFRFLADAAQLVYQTRRTEIFFQSHFSIAFQLSRPRTAGTRRRLRIPIAIPVTTPAPLMNMSRISHERSGDSFCPNSKATPSKIMARAAGTAADLRRMAASAIKGNDAYAKKCRTLRLMCKRPMATITEDLAGNKEPTTTQQISTAQTARIAMRLFGSRSVLSSTGGYFSWVGELAAQAVARFRAMELITIPNRCHHFRGFV